MDEEFAADKIRQITTSFVASVDALAEPMAKAADAIREFYATAGGALLVAEAELDLAVRDAADFDLLRVFDP